MPARNRNKLLMYRNIVNIVLEHYEEGVTSYAGIWRKHVYPVYPICYRTFLNILGIAGLDQLIKNSGQPPRSARMDDTQRSLFK